MKFERGRKKNQLIWSFILKDIASQSSVFNKTRKRKRFEENTLSNRGKCTLDIALPLKPAWVARGSLTVGPAGPLVRFD